MNTEDRRFNKVASQILLPCVQIWHKYSTWMYHLAKLEANDDAIVNNVRVYIFVNRW